MTSAASPFLVDLLNARSPSGSEGEAQKVIDKYVSPSADEYHKDTMGNRISVINPEGTPSLMLAGHIDELGLQINYVDKDGFLYFNTLGGHDSSVIPGRRVTILTKEGEIRGVTGKRAIHLMTAEDRKKVPTEDKIWIDIGASSKEEALKRIQLGDVAVYDQSFDVIHENVVTARAFDDKAGAYLVCEALRRLAKENSLQAKVTAVATTQEEVGCRGAIPSAYAVAPQVAIAVDVGHATDHPDCDHRKHGEFKMGGGPLICKGPNINPIVFDRLIACAEKESIPYQIDPYPLPTGTDARSIQISRAGVATGLVSIPLRYMHTPSEVVNLEDIENGVKLVSAFALSLQKDDSFLW